MFVVLTTCEMLKDDHIWNCKYGAVRGIGPTEHADCYYWMCYCFHPRRDHLYLKVDIIFVKRNTIKVFFSELCTRITYTLFRDSETSKIGKKGLFLVMVTNFGKKWWKIKKKHAKHVFMFFLFCFVCLFVFIFGKYMFWVCF